MKIPIGIRKDKNVPASALFGVAVIQIFTGVIGWFIYSAELGRLGTIICFSGFIYIALGIVARWFQLSAALVGTVLYAAFLLFEGYHGGYLLMTPGLLYKVPIVTLLFVAVVSALRCPRVYKVAIMSLAIAFLISLGFLVHVLWVNSLWKQEVAVHSIYEGWEQAKHDFQKGKLRLFEFHGKNEKDKFSGRHQGPFEIWTVEYDPSLYVERFSQEQWVESYNQCMESSVRLASNAAPVKVKSEARP
ncbi:MAG: hypothetical protein ABSD57_12605 [Verrucomicrobiota bacterium]|jgi:hypothetical protein